MNISIQRNNMLRRVLMLLGVLLAVACGRKENPGLPYILYEIHGTVVDQDGNPLEGIKVISGTSEAALTSPNGLFVVFGKSVPTASESALITCEDTDGDSNGGSFMKTSLNVNLRLRSAGSGNNKGNYFASDVVVMMLPKSDGMQGGETPPIPY